ncbi:hypothetical protein [Dickeya solani]|uniref:Uncharacterized protein n=1 Tax=Dickeya solani TaxID=1089444 RepID=A0ABU4EMC9_9GAMM|nr:hypothetical protein [Dickeya solani]MCA6998191.1 hypothetical protein [Dickeya solani]MCA6999514.1 hypothetical protein [Dickeya solani]MCZ0823872.1 hypothetical protein [Dickeya solani]MDV6997228.1 hypothetical protein [Dickeya solani]MDV7006502.1 hypothetical protein [Dickeya solani]
MMCDCFDRIGTMLHERLSEGVPDGAEISSPGGFDTGWGNAWLGLGTGRIHIMLKYKLAYRAKKKDGAMAKNLTRKETSVRMSFCPFCGQPMS